MANNIKGITVEIGGDTSPLQNALKDVNKTSRDLQSELKEVNKQLKLDPENTVLLEQKQKLLADSVANTKVKLDTLKEAEKQVEQQFKDGKVGEEQYRALQREVISTEQKLESLEKEAIKSNAVLSKEDAVNNLENIGKVAAGTAVAAGAALGGMAVSVLNNADELQRQADVTGISAERLQELQYAGNNLGVELDTMTGSMSKNIKSMSSARDAQVKWKESIDAQVKTGKISQEQADEMIETGQGLETAYSKLGIRVMDANGNLRDSTEVYNETLTALNGVDNETERNALAMQIFGKSAMEMNPMIKAGGDEINRLSNEAKKNGAVMSNDAVAALDTFGDTMDSLKTSILGSFGEKLAGLMPTLQNLIDKLMNLPQWVQQNSTLLTVLGIVLGTIIALIIAFNIQQALMASGLTLWGAIAAGATTVTTGLGVAFAFLTSPIGLVILAIGAVIAIGVLLYKNWDTVKAKAGELGTDVKNKFNQVKESIMNPINAATSFVEGQINKIKGFFSGLKLELPKIKLPHFSIKGSFSLSPPSIPSLGVDWYDKGGIFTSPQVIGVGEKRPEFVGALDDLKNIMREVMSEKDTSSSIINFNGNYSFSDKGGIDYFMNQAALLVKRKK